MENHSPEYLILAIKNFEWQTVKAIIPSFAINQPLNEVGMAAFAIACSNQPSPQ